MKDQIVVLLKVHPKWQAITPINRELSLLKKEYKEVIVSLNNFYAADKLAGSVAKFLGCIVRGPGLELLAKGKYNLLLVFDKQGWNAKGIRTTARQWKENCGVTTKVFSK